MKQQWYKVFVINILVACALTFVVNMSFFLLAGEFSLRKEPMPFTGGYSALRVAYTFVMALAALTITTSRRLNFLDKVLLTTVLMLLFFLFTPVVGPPPISPPGMRHSPEGYGEVMVLIQSKKPILMHSREMLNFSFILIVTLLYGKVYELVYQRQFILIENEKLKNENLQTRYNMLASQISPHFLFNSLNSLSMLVREDEKEKALHYLDKLSDTFRYMLQSGQSEMITLADELHFTDAYIYLHTIRYESKLFCDIDVEPRYLSWKLPSMSLQPLIENAVKHNSITKASPLRISIKTHNGNLVVSNDISPKIDDTEGTGIGLKNLASRYSLLTSHEITVRNDGREFTVILPLTRP